MITISATIIIIVVLAAVYYQLIRTHDTSTAEKFTIWLIFSVILALAPLVFNAILTFAMGKVPALNQLISKGELLIVSVAIGADAIGKLFGSGSPRKILKIATGGGCVILIVISSLLFSVISTTSLSATFDPNRVTTISVLMFIMTIITSGSCTLLAEVRE